MAGDAPALQFRRGCTFGRLLLHFVNFNQTDTGCVVFSAKDGGVVALYEYREDG
jgi:hypothetical protein